MRIGLISGGYPPDLDGIGDYTYWLAQTLAAHPEIEAPVEVFTSIGRGRMQMAGVQVSEFLDLAHPDSFHQLLASPNLASLDWLVLQYNPFSYGRRGYCPAVPQALAKLKKQKRPRIAVMFHETTVPRWPWKFALMYLWQWPLFRKVCQIADLAFVSTQRWLPQVHRAAPQLPVYHLPVGSNILRCESSRSEARQKLQIDNDTLVFGVFGSAHLSRRLDWIRATLIAAKVGIAQRSLLLYVGPDGQCLRNACPEASLIDCGILPADEVGLRLCAMDVLLSPFLDGVSTRRGSVIAALQHGVPVATTCLHWTDELFFTAPRSGLLLSSAKTDTGFAADTLAWLRKYRLASGHEDPEIKSFYERHFSWRTIASSLLQHL